jgi:hypothetical protein
LSVHANLSFNVGPKASKFQIALTIDASAAQWNYYSPLNDTVKRILMKVSRPVRENQDDILLDYFQHRDMVDAGRPSADPSQLESSPASGWAFNR